MKTLLAILALAALFLPALSAIAQEAAAAPALAPAPDAIALFIQMLAGRFPWVTSIVAFIGTFRLIAKPVCMWLERRALETPDAEDDLLLRRLRRSTPVKVLDFFLDLGFSVKRDVALSGLKKSKLPLPLLLAFILPLSTFSLLTGCALLSPAQNTALKAIAKAAVIFGLQQLGDSVKEVRPYQPALLGVINATFTATDNAASLGDALAAGVNTVVKDEALRAQVLAALKAQLKGAPVATANHGPQTADRQARYNGEIAARL